MRTRSKVVLCVIFMVITLSMNVINLDYPSNSSILEAPGQFQGEALFLPLGNETKVNNYTLNGQEYPAVSALTADTLAVAWHSDGQDGSNYGVYAVVINATTGKNLTAEFRVNNYTLNDQLYPDVSTLTADTFAVVWMSYGQDGDSFGVYAAIFNATTGKNLTAEFRVNTNTTYDQGYPSISALTADTFAVAWYSYGQDESGYGVYAAVFNATTGANLTAEFRVNTHTANDQKFPVVCALTANTFAVAWQSRYQDESGYGVYAAVFNATTGKNLTAEFRVNTNTTNDQACPSISALTADTFVVTWSSDAQDGSGNGVYAAVFNATTGKNLTAEFRVNTYTSNAQWFPAVITLTADTFAVAWMSFMQEGPSYGVYAAVFNATTGTNLTAEFHVNTYTPNDQIYPAVSALTADTFAVAWYGYGQDGSDYDVYVAVFDRLKAPLLDSMPTPSVDGTIHLTWAAVPRASWYYVFRATTPITVISGMIAIATTTACNFTDTILENGEYFYVIVAGHARGNSSISNCENNTRLIPLDSPFLYPILPEIDADGIVELKWSKMTNAAIYFIFKDTSYILSTEGLMPIAAITGTNYTDQLLNNNYYYYAVVASDGWVNSSVSNCQYVSVARDGAGSQPDNTWLFILIAGVIIAAAIIVHGFMVRGRPSGQSPAKKLPPPPKPKQ